MEISVKEARSHFSSILDKVEDGREIIIRRRGKEVARLICRGSGQDPPEFEEIQKHNPNERGTTQFSGQTREKRGTVLMYYMDTSVVVLLSGTLE